MADAAVRYFCLVLPNGGAQLGYDYLEAFEQTGLGVRACPIGPAFFMSGAWPKLTHCFFVGQVAKSYVNVICAPPNLLMGQALCVADVRPPADAGGVIGGRPKKDSDEIVYKPQTALSGLFTVGVPNIAITMPRPKPPDEHEVAALSKYDAVLCPSDEDAAALRHLGITAFHVAPEPKQLTRIVSWLKSSF